MRKPGTRVNKHSVTNVVHTAAKMFFFSHIYIYIYIYIRIHILELMQIEFV